MKDSVVKESFDTSLMVVDSVKRLTYISIKKAWSILDAASEKRAPSEAISQKGIRVIQGNAGG
jgi:hypothetical protein